MQVTELQVQRSIEALSNEVPGEVEAADRTEELPDGLVEQITGSPSIRDGRIEEARRRLESGEKPTAEALAQRMVGRLVCDRLR
jgi:hypothetical protein